MALEPLRTYRSFSRGVDVIAVLIWSAWLIFFSAWFRNFSYAITFMPMMLIFGAVRWSFLEGAAWLLLMSWIFATFSSMTSGVIWITGIVGFLVVKLFVLRFSISRGVQLAVAVFFISLLFYLCQAWILRGVIAPFHFSWTILGRILLSALFESIASFAMVPFSLSYFQTR